MKILVLNCGSSSVKFKAFDMAAHRVIAKGQAEKIGSANAIFTYEPAGGDRFREVDEILDHRRAIQIILDALTSSSIGVIKEHTEIQGVGHRVVHGGEAFSDSVRITPEVVAEIDRCIELAPLHNPPNLRGIEAAMELLPGAAQVATFDTAFHQTLPPKAFYYGIPFVLYQRYRIRRYGFHGTSHRYVFQEAMKILKREPEGCRAVTCHLGNGASLTAIKDGKSVDTSMGFTPLEGLIMGTRCGDIDPAIVPFVVEKEGLSIHGANSMMNKHSGLYGISGISQDMRELEMAAEKGNERARMAIEMFCYRIRKYLGAYAAVLGGLDLVIFTGGIGENASSVRHKVCEGLDYLGIQFDQEANRGNKTFVSHGPCQVLVIPTDEELMIAKETMTIIEG